MSDPDAVMRQLLDQVRRHDAMVDAAGEQLALDIDQAARTTAPDVCRRCPTRLVDDYERQRGTCELCAINERTRHQR